MILWLLLFLSVALLVFAISIGLFIRFLKKKSLSVRCVIIFDDGSTVKREFNRAPESFSHQKKTYLYDERAVVRFGGVKHLFFRNNVPEPILMSGLKNPRILSSTEYNSLLRSRIHEELFGASEIGLIKVLVIATLAIAVGTALIALIILFSSPTEMMLADNEATRSIIEESVKRAIGR